MEAGLLSDVDFHANSEARPRPVLSRDVIAEAALRLTLEQPNTPLTLSRLGAELGADPTAIYRHFRNRDELLLDLLDRMYGEALASIRPTQGWQEQLSETALALRRTMLHRPALSAEVGSRFTGGRNEQTGVAAIIDTFRSAGLGDGDATAHAWAFGAFVLATIVASAAALTHDEDTARTDTQVAVSLYGEPAGMLPADYEAATFALMLRTHLTGLAAIVRHTVDERDHQNREGTT
jgi:AcrR family transcriptional regulator